MQQRVENRHKLRAAHGRITGRVLSMAFTTWSTLHEEKMILRGKLEAVVTRLAAAKLSAAFESWRATSQRSMQTEGFVWKLRDKWRGATIRSAFEHWFAWATRRAELSLLHRNVSDAYCHRRKSRLMRGWNLLFVACCTYRLYMARLALSTWSKGTADARHERILRGAAVRLAMRTSLLCFEAWAAWHRDRMQRIRKWTEIVDKVTRRKAKLTTSRTFNAWADLAHDQASFIARATLRAESLALRLLKDTKYTILATWRDWMRRRQRTRRIGAGIVAAREEVEAAARMRLWRQRYVQSTAIRTIRRASMSTAWGHWFTYRGLLQTKRQKFEVAARRWKQSNLSMRYQHWQNCISEADRLRSSARVLQTRPWFLLWLRAAEAERCAKLDAAVKHMCMHSYQVAFETWRDYSMKTVWQRVVVVKAVRRAHSRLLASSFDMWKTLSTRKSRNKDALASALAGIHSRLAAVMFAQWVAVAAHRTRRKSLLQVAAGKLQLRVAAVAIECWKAGVVQSKRERERMMIAMEQMAMRISAAAFEQWWVHANHTAQLRGLLGLWLGRRVAALLSQYLLHWHTQTLVNGHRRWVADTIAVATCARLAKRIWKEWKLAHVCSVVERGVKARKLKAALCAWLGAVQRIHALDGRLEAIIRHRAQRKKALLIAAWRYFAVYARRSRQVVGASRFRRHRMHAARCFDVWRASVEYAMELRNALGLWLGRRVAVMHAQTAVFAHFVLPGLCPAN